MVKNRIRSLNPRKYFAGYGLGYVVDDDSNAQSNILATAYVPRKSI